MMTSDSNYSYLNKSTKSSHSDLSSDSVDSDNYILLKLRRLKIEEQVLLKSIASVDKELQIDNNSDMCNFANFLTKLKNSFIEVRNLYEEVKENTCSVENLKNVDITEIKKDVFELEEKIKAAKSHTQSELAFLKIAEQELQNKMNHDSATVDIVKRRSKTKLMPFNDVVPSPVKIMITSPFKSVEVQQFQEFMMHSKNRCGGWIPYNHNIFQKCWKKHFPASEHESVEKIDVAKFGNYHLFFREIMQKIPGVTTDDVLEHSKWYSNFLYLKNRQQVALNKWKSNKLKIKRCHQKSKQRISNHPEDSKHDMPIKEGEETDELRLELNHYDDTLPPSSEIMQSSDRLRYLNPTVQWSNKCADKRDSHVWNTDVTTIQKLFSPKWRDCLNEG